MKLWGRLQSGRRPKIAVLRNELVAVNSSAPVHFHQNPTISKVNTEVCHGQQCHRWCLDLKVPKEWPIGHLLHCYWMQQMANVMWLHLLSGVMQSRAAFEWLDADQVGHPIVILPIPCTSESPLTSCSQEDHLQNTCFQVSTQNGTTVLSHILCGQSRMLSGVSVVRKGHCDA